MKAALSSVNPLALLALLVAGALTAIGRLEPESFMLLVTGLAIPARAGGYTTAVDGEPVDDEAPAPKTPKQRRPRT